MTNDEEDHDIPLLGANTDYDTGAAAAQLSMMGGIAIVLGSSKTVSDIRYESVSGTDVIRLVFEDGEEATVPNGGFTAVNPALCVLAYLGARPSELEAAEGETIPAVVRPDGSVDVPGFVIDEGRETLKESVWGPDGGVEETIREAAS